MAGAPEEAILANETSDNPPPEVLVEAAIGPAILVATLAIAVVAPTPVVIGPESPAVILGSGVQRLSEP